jgi:hypothetical protein
VAVKIAYLILIVCMPIAAFDAFYYHIYRFRLYDQPSSRMEEVTHILRAINYGVYVTVMTYGRPEGAFYWGFAAAMSCELVVGIWDTLIEPESRKPLGGIPRFEYALHVFGSMVIGAVFLTYLSDAWPLRLNPTAMVPHPPGIFPRSVLLLGWSQAVATAGLIVLKCVLFGRSLLRARRAAAQPSRLLAA